MTSTPVTLLSKRSGNSSDRPLPTTVQVGELAINFAAADNGLYFKDSAGDIRKITGTHYATTAPNVGAVGQTGNSVGETWVDSSTSSYYLSVWNGSSWQKIGAAFADVAASATVPIASGAIVANSAIVASGAFGAILASGALGAILSSGSLHADGADLASGALGAILSSGSLHADGAIVASGAFGAILASGALGAILSSGSLHADGADLASGALGAILSSGSLHADGAIVASGAFGAILASGALGAILSSGSLHADGADLASGVVSAAGVPSATVFTGSFPAVAESGTLAYKNDSPSGLYVAVNGGWALI